MIAGPTTSAADARTALTETFEFSDAGRTFTCAAEPLARAAGAEAWWWFRVGGDSRGQRYAPFRAAADDTRDGVQARVVAYYDDLLVRRAAPPAHTPWGRRAASGGGSFHPVRADAPADAPTSMLTSVAPGELAAGLTAAPDTPAA